MSEAYENMKVQSQLKNTTIGMVLAFCFGSLGLMYSTIKGGLIMLIPTGIAVVLCLTGIGLIVGLPMLFAISVVNAIWAKKACEAHNESVFSMHESEKAHKAA